MPLLNHLLSLIYIAQAIFLSPALGDGVPCAAGLGKWERRYFSLPASSSSACHVSLLSFHLLASFLAFLAYSFCLDDRLCLSAIHTMPSACMPLLHSPALANSLPALLFLLPLLTAILFILECFTMHITVATLWQGEECGPAWARKEARRAQAGGGGRQA